jgi:HSP20 family protein
VAGKTKRHVSGRILFRGSFLGEGDRLADGSLLMVPAVDLYETPDCYMLSAELPGVAGEDVHVDVRGSEISIWGERKVEMCCSEESYHRLEGLKGRFHRTFSLPETFDEDANIQATLLDGVLQVTLAKSSKCTRIKIRGPQEGR